MFVNTLLLWCFGFYYYLFNHKNLDLQDVDRVKVFGTSAYERFEVVYQWSYLNYSWNSIEQYIQAIETGKYIPANNAPTGMKFYQNTMFLTIPRFRPGVPATLVYLDMNSETNFENPLLNPYPNWLYNDHIASCSNLQSVQSLEVDTKGVMWIIDGVRINNYTRCPPKLVLLDLNDGGAQIHSYVFPERLVMHYGGFLNDIVVDEIDGGFAYITDNSQKDPGIIVYSRRRNHSWKLRHKSMLPEPNAVVFPVDDIIFDAPVPVDGIALSPIRTNGEKILFYCSISSFSIFSVPTSVIKSQKYSESGEWRKRIKFEGRKDFQSDGIMIDEQANMYLTMLPDYGVALWNINQPLSTLRSVDTNRRTMVWPDGLGFDQQGHMYLISNKIFNYIDLRRTPAISHDIPYRILRIFTGTRSYLYG